MQPSTIGDIDSLEKSTEITSSDNVEKLNIDCSLIPSVIKANNRKLINIEAINRFTIFAYSILYRLQFS